MRHAEHYAHYEALLKRYLAPLQRLAYAYTREPSAREDLFQEIALALWTALPSFRGEASERTWLYRVAHDTANPERSAIDSQQRARLWAALRTLPLSDRRLVMLHLEGLSAAEIAHRNAREYVAVVGVVLWASWQMMAGGDRIAAGVAIAGALLVGGYLWRQHRQDPPLDPSMSARDYQAALLQRIDLQIRLLKRVRYWYFLPLSLPSLRIAALNWGVRPWSTLLFLAIVATIFILGVLLNEFAVAFYLRKERAQVQSLYESEES